MLLLGFLSHRFWICSKNLATPTWAFWCLAIFLAFYGLLWWLTAVKPDLTGRLYRPIRPAGTATLTCYTIPTIWYAVWQLLGLHWPAALTNGLPGLLKALALAFLIIGITWIFEKIHLKLKV
jgi:hypothetical protein